MNPAAYGEMALIEDQHWWFVARRKILAEIIKKLPLPQSPHILEVGFGTGGNLVMLATFGKVKAFDMSQEACAITAEKLETLGFNSAQIELAQGSCPDHMPFDPMNNPEMQFDLICVFDVLEHIREDAQTLINLKKYLKPNGLIFLTVPAYQWLYGPHDQYVYHERRYSKKSLKKVLKQAKYFNILKISYFNTFLFPPAVLVRLKEKIFQAFNHAKQRDQENQDETERQGMPKIPSSFLNKIFQKIFASESFFLKKISLPAGLSILCVLQVAVDENE